jgi:16S rRNA (uracil1498-N3)-methyltransferase
MYNFFTNTEIVNGHYILDGDNYNHIKNVLRMKIGEQIIISDGVKNSLTEIVEFTDQEVKAKVITENYINTELPVKITLFQGLPKVDKLEFIIQKAVELGVYEIFPVSMKRSVVKIEENKKQSKLARWQAISESAGKQCKRTIIPQIPDVVSLNKAIDICKDYDLIIVPYEDKDGMTTTLETLKLIKNDMKIALFIGPEGGFDQKEIDDLINCGAKIVSLGKRILRTETASLTALSMIMLYTEINL